jgi:hypothetical protein
LNALRAGAALACALCRTGGGSVSLQLQAFAEMVFARTLEIGR